MKRILWTLALAATLATAALLSMTGPASALADDGAAQAPAAQVKIDNFSFGPAVLTVAPGTKVTWTNRDDIPHTVVADDKSFKSKVLDTDETFSYTFDKAGT